MKSKTTKATGKARLDPVVRTPSCFSAWWKRTGLTLFCSPTVGSKELALRAWHAGRQCPNASGEGREAYLAPRGSACLGALLARDIFAVGDFPEKTTRLQFMSGKWPNHENAQGGLCEKSFAEVIAKCLAEYLPNAAPHTGAVAPSVQALVGNSESEVMHGKG